MFPLQYSAAESKDAAPEKLQTEQKKTPCHKEHQNDSQAVSDSAWFSEVYRAW